MGLFQNCALVVAAVCVAVQWYQRRNHRSIKDIQGPPSTWLLGNELDIWWQEQLGETDFKWMAQYGNAWRVGGCFGEDVLVLADPKALQHIFRGYNYPKRADFRQTIRFLTGTGLLYADGADHHRQKRVIDPGFGPGQLRQFYPIFRSKAAKLSTKLREALTKSEDKIINIAPWLAHTTLDIIGETALNYPFNTLDNHQDELTSVYENLFIDAVTFPPAGALIFKGLWCYLPEWILPWMAYLPAKQLRVFRRYMGVARRVASQLLDDVCREMVSGQNNRRDVMSLMVRANSTQGPKQGMTNDELVSQMTTLMLAGHETTASSMNWLLWELSKDLEYQALCREEIANIRSQAIARGDDDLSMTDLENMPYVTAIVKETFRFHPIAYHLVRKAGHDDVIPLLTPIRTKSGQFVTEIPVSKGQSVIASVCAYNRCAEVWGDDAHVFNPRRYLNREKKEGVPTVGVYGDVLTFAAGARACIGWKFSVIELHSLVVELLENFELSFPEGKTILRVPAIAMTCMVEGEREKGVQMPIRLKPLVNC
ncbi:cytochrome P450 [Thelephora terrestris]|uniref:Cytochrome P450 n=1 Tax=Thelephora terrestris TaxID=56493 RepID=A0A9P6HB86_9AGAM|nr:cytochrome P450 [Thelephora terrestris]